MELPLVDPRDPNYNSDRDEAEEVGSGVRGNKTIKFNSLVPDMIVLVPYDNPFWEKALK